ALRQPTLGYLVATLVFWIVLTWMRARSGDRPAAVATGLLAIAGVGSILIPEVVYLRDAFQSRMNSVFKFYYDAWILLALASPALAWELWTLVVAHATEVRSSLRPAASAAAGLAGALVLVGTMY